MWVSFVWFVGSGLIWYPRPMYISDQFLFLFLGVGLQFMDYKARKGYHRHTQVIKISKVSVWPIMDSWIPWDSYAFLRPSNQSFKRFDLVTYCTSVEGFIFVWLPYQSVSMKTAGSGARVIGHIDVGNACQLSFFDTQTDLSCPARCNHNAERRLFCSKEVYLASGDASITAQAWGRIMS